MWLGGRSKKNINIDPQKILIEAKALTFSELPEAVKAKTSNSFVFKPIGYEPEEIEKQNGFYLRLTLNNSLLAKASTWENMSKEEDLLDSSNLFGLYGKYRNRPDLYNSKNKIIDPTRKHEGYDLITVFRNNQIDTTFWGPLKELPTKLILHCSNLDSSTNPNIIITRL